MYLESSACDNNPCKNGGECITDGEKYKCTCPLMFFGDECQFGKNHCRLLSVATTSDFQELYILI